MRLWLKGRPKALKCSTDRNQLPARQGVDLFLWPYVLGQQDSRGILTSSALRIKLKTLLRCAGHVQRKVHAYKHAKCIKSFCASYKMPTSQAMRTFLNA